MSCDTCVVTLPNARALRWGALLAFVGLFFMHGASASAAEAHCGGSFSPGHMHSNSPHEAMVAPVDLLATLKSPIPSQTPTLEAAALGAPITSLADHVGELCVAILLAGFLILTLTRVRSSFGAQLEATRDAHSAANDARPPPRLIRTMLSIWRN